MRICHGFVAAGVLILSLAVCRAARAAGVVVNFDDYSSVGLSLMGNSPGSAVPEGSKLSDQYLNSYGVTFSSTSNYIAIGEFGTTSSPAGIGGVTSDGKLSYDDPVTVTFFLPGTSIPAVTNSVSIAGDATGISSQSASFTAYDINAVAINSQTRQETEGASNIWSVSSPAIHSATFSGGNLGQPYGYGTGIALDDLKFGTLIPALLGDATGDGSVDAADFAVLQANFGRALAGYPNGDFNGDGVVNGDDWAMLALGAAQYDEDHLSLPEPVACSGLIFFGYRLLRRRPADD